MFLVSAFRAAGASLAAGPAAACQVVSGGAARPRGSPARCVPSAAGGPAAARQLRGTWIGSFKNLDWPSRPGLPAARQRAELTGLLAQAARLRLNAVLLQVRPTADALYASDYEPWSKWLTGTQGGSPGYDPLEFAVAAAHAAGLELHAWFNPYRVSEQPDRRKLAAAHPASRHPGWVVEYGGQLWYDPGNPAARDLAVTVIGDVARRYDIDGVHLDDYFYPYPVGGQPFGDGRTFRRYGGGFTSRADWRRQNVNQLIAQICAEVRRAAPWLKFGVSPFGIWRNASTDPAGSGTSGLQGYDDLYADVRGWIRGGLLDYVAPQLYWEIGNPAVPYEELVRWWSRAVTGTGTQLYVGQAAFRTGAWRDPGELARHLAFDGGEPGIDGELFFHATSLAAGGRPARLAARAFAAPAHPPVPERLRGWLTAPRPPPPAGWLRREGIGGCAGP